jgi:tetratricopeptide (TPR) repeat protein
MKKNICNLIMILPLFLSVPEIAFSAQVVLDSEKQFSFANHFIDREEYDRAVQELERLVYFFPEDPRVHEARYLIGWCYIKERRFERARKILWQVHQDQRLEELGSKALLLIGESYEFQDISEEASYYYKRIIVEYPETEIAEEARYRLGWAKMDEGKWREASETFRQVSEKSVLRDDAMDLSQLSLEGYDIPTKSPTAAGVMAGVLPGLGHAYCGRYKDATISLIINGLFTWAAIEAFNRDLDALGGLLGVMELGWYSGNIYSAVNCAHKYNKKAQEDFLRNLPKHLGVYSTDKDVGLALRFEF